MLGGGAAYSLLGLLGSPLPGPPSIRLGVAISVASLASLAWYLRPDPTWLPSPRRQVARIPITVAPVKGALIFGTVLGVGLLTKITTPLVWLGLAATIARGSPFWGFAYGSAFGVGRSVQLFVEYFSRLEDPGARVERTTITQARLYRPVGLGIAVWMLGTGLLLLV